MKWLWCGSVIDGIFGRCADVNGCCYLRGLMGVVRVWKR